MYQNFWGTALVEWFNAVDGTYRADLRELNELNFSRFDAELEQRLADSDAKWERRISALDVKWERRTAQLEARWDGRLTELEAKWDGRLTELEAKWNKRLTGLEANWDKRLTERDAEWEGNLEGLRSEMHALRAELIKWTFVAVAAGTATVLGVAAAFMAL